MKTLSPRQKELLALIAQRKNLSVSEVQSALGVSQATAYREAQTLIKLGLVAKIPGGISQPELSASLCVQCGRETSPRAAFLFEQKDGARFSACCAHCGLIVLSRNKDISIAMATDFFYGTILNVRRSWYVLNSDVSLCCQPSILCFSSRKDADKFVLGFGGEVMDFSTIQKSVNQIMEL